MAPGSNVLDYARRNTRRVAEEFLHCTHIGRYLLPNYYYTI